MESMYTPQEIADMKEFLKKHPIDHRRDPPPGMVVFDEDMSVEQFFARLTADILKDLGELPEEELYNSTGN